MEIEYKVEIDPSQKDSAFYCSHHGWETLATVTAGERRFVIGVNGEMRLDLPNGDVWRYTQDLLENNIDTDEKLSIFSALYPNAWTNNNWFEMYEINADGEDCGWFDVYDYVTDAVEAVREILENEMVSV